MSLSKKDKKTIVTQFENQLKTTSPPAFSFLSQINQIHAQPTKIQVAKRGRGPEEKDNRSVIGSIKRKDPVLASCTHMIRQGRTVTDVAAKTGLLIDDIFFFIGKGWIKGNQVEISQSGDDHVE